MKGVFLFCMWKYEYKFHLEFVHKNILKFFLKSFQFIPQKFGICP